MRLLVDIGNSRLKWRLLAADGTRLDGDAFVHGRSDPSGWGDQLWRNRIAHPRQVVIANVTGPQTASALTTWIHDRWASDTTVVTSEPEAFGIRNGYSEPRRLGVDRWVALIGARTLLGPHRSCAVIDCGTAVTVDALDAAGEHLGGVILPGSRLMLAALQRNTELLPQIDIPGGLPLLGRNTQDCIWSGTVNAIAAAIDRVSGHIHDSAPAQDAPPVRLLTGGSAPDLEPYLSGSYRLEPELMFYGLRTIAEHALAL